MICFSEDSTANVFQLAAEFANRLPIPHRFVFPPQALLRLARNRPAANFQTGQISLAGVSVSFTVLALKTPATSCPPTDFACLNFGCVPADTIAHPENSHATAPPFSDGVPYREAVYHFASAVDESAHNFP